MVPRSWTHLLFEAAGRPLDPGAATPGRWREYVPLATGQAAPDTMTEGAPVAFASFDDGYNPADPVDQAIMATRKADFPLHGLMPWLLRDTIRMVCDRFARTLRKGGARDERTRQP